MTSEFKLTSNTKSSEKTFVKGPKCHKLSNKQKERSQKFKFLLGGDAKQLGEEIKILTRDIQPSF